MFDNLRVMKVRDFLGGLPEKSKLIFFHDPLTDREFYP